MGQINLDYVRSAFPTLSSDTVFLENAGGSQVPKVVADAIHQYMLNHYVQLGAGYATSQTCTGIVDAAHAFVSRLMNAARGKVILGSSTTVLIHILAECYGQMLPAGSEVVLAECGHEANLGPWARLADRGIAVRWWPVDPASGSSTLEALDAVLSERTALLAFPHVSNLLGEIIDVAEVTRRAHAAGARVVVDGVALAPHRAMDVDAWDVDWYVYSTYKVYGPHMAALYGRDDALAELTGPNHFFIPKEELPYKFELGGPSHEGCAGLLALGEYLKYLIGCRDERTCDRQMIVAAFGQMTACERPLQAALLEYLTGKQGVRVIGPTTSDAARRVSTISFVHDAMSSRDITAAIDRSGVAIRHGHMYAYRLCKALSLDPEDGVVRVSAVHYNTPSEVDGLIQALEAVLP